MIDCLTDPTRGKRTPQRWFKPPNLSEWDRPLPPEWNGIYIDVIIDVFYIN